MAYQPIDSYGMIGDLRTIALVGTDASLDYMCFPHVDSPTVFAALRDDAEGGRFSIAPVGGVWRHKQLYLPDTNVLVTQFPSEDGIGEVTDLMPVEERHHAHRVVRRVTALKGMLTFQICCDPRFDYARASHTATLQPDGAVRFEPVGEGLHALRLHSSAPLEVDGSSATARVTLGPDRRRGRPAPLDVWQQPRDDIYHEVFDHFYDEKRQAFVQYARRPLSTPRAC